MLSCVSDICILKFMCKDFRFMVWDFNSCSSSQICILRGCLCAKKLLWISIQNLLISRQLISCLMKWMEKMWPPGFVYGYLKNGDLSMAQSLFDEMPKKDVISWNSMVMGYMRTGNMDYAYSLFKQMPKRNSASWNSMISGYVDHGKIELARGFYDAMPQRNNISCITMISRYSKYGNVESANEFFDQMGEKDQLLYNVMIACYSQNSRLQEALELFNEMIQPHLNIQPDKMTLGSVISACSQLGDLRFGTWIESYMSHLGIGKDDHLATALIDLHAKCESIDKHLKVLINYL